MKQKILELHAAGHTRKQIAYLVGCTTVNVGYHLNKNVSARVIRQRQLDRQLTINKLKQEAGGKCLVCSYNKCLAALDFHHKNPKDKISNITTLMHNRSIAKAKREAKKCVLLCCRCHRELHAGLIVI